MSYGDRPRLRVVNTTGLGHQTQVFIDDQDVSSCFNEMTVAITMRGAVEVTLNAIVCELEFDNVPVLEMPCEGTREVLIKHGWTPPPEPAPEGPAVPRPWRTYARPKQLPPETDWRVFLATTDRGWGKTRAGSEWIAEQAATHPNTEWAVIAPTWRDCRKVCIEGASGIVKALLPGELTSVSAMDLAVRLSNGSTIYGYSADNPGRLRGVRRLSGAWVDELSAMPNAETLWDDYLMPTLGDQGRVFVTATSPMVDHELNPMHQALLSDTTGTVITVFGKTWENAANLSESTLAALREHYGEAAR